MVNLIKMSESRYQANSYSSNNSHYRFNDSSNAWNSAPRYANGHSGQSWQQGSRSNDRTSDRDYEQTARKEDSSKPTEHSEQIPFNKVFYREHPEVTQRSEASVKEFREEMGIVIHGKPVPRPVTTFEEVNFPEYIIRTIKDVGFTVPTPIQCQGEF